MASNSIAGNVLGTMGTICWTGQLIPQVWKSYREKKTAGLSPWLMLIWGVSSAFLGVYAVLQHLNIPLQIQPQLFGFLALLSWGQCLYYDPRRQDKKCLSALMVAGTMVFVGALEVLLIFISRPAYERGISAPVELYGILSAVLLAVGLLPQYWEIYKLGEVKGISYTFICIDMLGGVLNDLSLVFSSEFDGLAAASYTIVTVMDSVIIFAALILNPRARRRRQVVAEGSNIDPEASPTTNMEVGEISAGSGIVDFPCSTTLNTVTGDSCDTNAGEKAGQGDQQEETTQNGACGEQEEDKVKGGDTRDPPTDPASGATTVVGDLDLGDTERSTTKIRTQS